MPLTKDDLLNLAVSEDSYCCINEINKSIAISSTNKTEINDRVKLANSFLVNSYLDFHDTNTNYSIDRYFKKEFQLIQALQGQRDFSDLKRINLPESIPLNMSLGQSISRRRSIRDFTGDAIDSMHVATLLRASSGITGRIKINLREDNEKTSVYFRAVASGGGLYPIYLYVVPLNVKRLPFAAYIYSPTEDALFEFLNNKKAENIYHGFFRGKEEVEEKRAALLIFYAAAPWQSIQKYGARGLRFVFHELGAITQNVNLTSAALGLGSLDYASFSEDRINRSMGFDGLQETVLHSSFVGIPG